MVEIGRTHARLLAGLVEARERAGMSGKKLASVLGWSQSVVSRIETGARRPRPDLVNAWLNATGADPERITELVDLAESINDQTKTWTEAYAEAGSAAAIQAAFGAMEARATRIVGFQPLFVPGLAQTPDYARAILAHIWGKGEDDLESAVAARMDRRAILHNPDRDITMLLLEGAVTQRVAPAHVIAGQLDRLEYLAGLSTARLGIIPSGALLPAPPANAFWLFEFDDEPPLINVETSSKELRVRDPDDVARFQAILSKYEALAAFGEDAATIIRRIRDALARTD